MQPHSPTRRNALGDISLMYVAVMARAMESLGHSPAPLLQRFGIDESLLQSPDARISIPRYMRMGQAAIDLTGRQDFGLVMGEQTRPVDSGLAGLTAQSAATAGIALHTLLTFSLLNSRNSRGHPQMNLETGTARFYSIRPYNIFNYFVVDSVLAAWTRFLRTITGEPDVLSRVRIEYPEPDNAQAYETWFGCPVLFSAGENSLSIDGRIRSMPCRDRQPAMFQQLREECERQLTRMRSGRQQRERVKEVLLTRLQGGHADLPSIATALGTTSWTLQRQLQAESTGFQQILDETRQELAREYIQETRLSFSEIAWLLGFSGPPAFHRAYRRWTGRNPGTDRASPPGRN